MSLTHTNPYICKSDFDRDGFAVIRGFFTPAEMDELGTQLDRYFGESIARNASGLACEVKGDFSTLKQVEIDPSHEPFFDAMRSAAKFVSLAETLLDGPVVFKHFQWFDKVPRIGKETPPHQDGYYFMLEPNEAISFWLALDPVDEGNGCVRYVPGSHRRGMRLHGRTQLLGFSQAMSDFGPEDEDQEEVTVLQPGDLLVHHGLTIHRAEANRSDRHRRALSLVYFAKRARQDKEGMEAYQRNLQRELAEAGKL